MLEIILIYFIGKKFYELSETYNHNKWAFAIIGVVTYFAAAFIFGVILGLLDAHFNLHIDWNNRLLMTFIGLPVGILACYGLYSILKKKWKREHVVAKEEIDDIGKLN